jgi:hypothetical protein
MMCYSWRPNPSYTTGSSSCGPQAGAVAGPAAGAGVAPWVWYALGLGAVLLLMGKSKGGAKKRGRK